MLGFLLKFLLILFFVITGCMNPPQESPVTDPSRIQSQIKPITGTWVNEQFAITLTIKEDGTYTWSQGNELRETGNYSLSGNTLLLSTSSGKATPYQIFAVSENSLSLIDPRGTLAEFTRVLLKENIETYSEPQIRGQNQTQELAKADNLSRFYGNWIGPYGIFLELKQNGLFTWKQQDKVVEGNFLIEKDAIILNVQGNPTKYKIIFANDEKLILQDPENHEFTLVKSKTKIIEIAENKNLVPGEQPGINNKLTNESSKAQTLLYDEKSIFSVTIPDGWKVNRKESCLFPCDEPYELIDSAGRKFSLILNSFITKAEPGALNKLTPELDRLMGPYSKDREKKIDNIDKMNGLEVFSRRFTGKTQDETEMMVARIIGVHFRDYLVLGVSIISFSNKIIKSIKPVVNKIIEAMNFDFTPDHQIESTIPGTWIGSLTTPPPFLSIKPKHIFFFYPEGKLIHAVVPENFDPTEENLKSQLINPANENGVFIIAGKALIIDLINASNEKKIELIPVQIKENKLIINSFLLEKIAIF